MQSSKEIGTKAELIAYKYLEANGMRLLHRNYFSRFGEIDLIMQDKDDDNAIVFVEVKMRKAGYNNALESITLSKQRKLTKTANYFLLKLGRDVICRFDAVIIDGAGNIEWLKNIIVS